MSDKNFLPQIVEDEASGEESEVYSRDDEKFLTKTPGQNFELTDMDNLSSILKCVHQLPREELESFCINLGDQIKHLKEKIKNVEEVSYLN